MTDDHLFDIFIDEGKGFGFLQGKGPICDNYSFHSWNHMLLSLCASQHLDIYITIIIITIKFLIVPGSELNI